MNTLTCGGTDLGVDLDAEVPCQISHNGGQCPNPAAWLFVACHQTLTCCQPHKTYRDQLIAEGWQNKCARHPEKPFTPRWIRL